MQNKSQIIKSKKKNYSEMNISEAFRTLDCDTLKKKWNYKLQYKKVLLLVHPDTNRLAETEDLGRVLDAVYFLDSYRRDLQSFGYETTKILFVWVIFAFLKNFLSKKRGRVNNEKTSKSSLEISTGNRKNLDLIKSSFILFVNEFFLLWWVLSLYRNH